MNATIRRGKDSIRVPEGRYTEVYVPKVGRILSPSLGKYLKYAKIYLSADANVTYKDDAGKDVLGFPLAKGRHDFLVTELSVVSAGTVMIVHDGLLSTGWNQ